MLKKKPNSFKDSSGVCGVIAGSPSTCCSILESVGEGVFTVDVDKCITFLIPLRLCAAVFFALPDPPQPFEPLIPRRLNF